MSISKKRARLGQVTGFTMGTLLASIAVFQASSAAFSQATQNGTNTFAAGGVTLVDDDSGAIMFELDELIPGDSFTRCIEVDYTGSSFDVTPIKLYFTEDSNTNNFADHLDVTIRQGAGGEFGDCTGFTSDRTLTTNTALSALVAANHDFGTGMTTYTPTAALRQETFEFTITLGADTPNTSQGDSAGAIFTWEIQSN